MDQYRATMKTITIYEAEAPEKRTKQRVLDRGFFSNIESMLIKKERDTNLPIESSIPSIKLKNIAYHILPIIKKTKGYVVPIQFVDPMVVYDGKSLSIAAPNSLVSVSGIYFDPRRTFIQRTLVIHKNTTIDEQRLAGMLGIRRIIYRYDYTKSIRIMSDLVGTIEDPPNLLYATMFKSAKHAENVITSLTNFTIANAKYHSAFYPAINAPHPLPIPKPLLTIKKRAPDNSPTTNEIGKLIGMDLSTTHPSSITSYVVGAGMWGAYVAAKIQGPFNDITKDAVALADRRINAGTKRTTYKIAKIKKASRIAWITNIAIREFGTADIKADQQAIVDQMYESELAMSAPNNCDHVPIYRRLMKSRHSGLDADLWTELKKFVKSNGASPIPKTSSSKAKTVLGMDSKLICAVCDRPLICPHLYMLFETTDVKATSDEYGIVDSIGYSNCRICGELVLKRIVIDNMWKTEGYTNTSNFDTLQNNMAGEIRSVLSMNLRADDSINIDMSTLTLSILSIIDPHVRSFHSKIMRIKSNSESMSMNSMYLITAIYAMTVLIHMSIMTDGSISIKDTPKRGRRNTGGGAKAAPGNIKKLHKLFNMAYGHITTQKEHTIISNPTFTAARIKTIMARAYQQISATGVSISTATPPTKIEKMVNLLDNPFYKYIFDGWQVSHISNGKKPLLPTNTKPILGMSIKDAVKTPNILTKAKLPPKWNPADLSWDIYAATATRIINGTLDGAKSDTIKFAKRRSKLYPPKPMLSVYPPQLEKKEIPPSIGLLYCESGERHNWNIHVYDVDKKSVEVREGEFGIVLIPTTAPYVGRKCSKCGDMYGKTPDGGIMNRIVSRRELISVSSYYAVRCPNGGRHEWAGAKCGKCGASNTNSPEFRSKHLATYRATMSIPTIKQVPPKKTDLIVIKRIIKTLPISWVVTSVPASKLANMVNMPLNLFLNIGLTMNTKFCDIINNKVNPSMAKDPPWQLQLDMTSNMVTSVITKLKRFTMCNTSGMDATLVEVCDSSPDSASKIKIPRMLEHYSTKRAYMCEPTNIQANWMLSELAIILVGVGNTDTGMAFVHSMAEDIKTAVENTSKPPLYKRVIARIQSKRDELEFGQTRSIGAEKAEEVDSIMNIVESDPFSMEAVDVDEETMEGNDDHSNL
jgi:hypothetical protein